MTEIYRQYAEDEVSRRLVETARTLLASRRPDEIKRSDEKWITTLQKVVVRVFLGLK
jgi:hypothetical protein